MQPLPFGDFSQSSVILGCVELGPATANHGARDIVATIDQFLQHIGDVRPTPIRSPHKGNERIEAGIQLFKHLAKSASAYLAHPPKAKELAAYQ